MCLPTLPKPGSGKILMFLRPSIFWNVVWHRLVVGYRLLGQLIRPILKGQAVTFLDFWTLEDGTDVVSKRR
jgi:hypothetical protein